MVVEIRDDEDIAMGRMIIIVLVRIAMMVIMAMVMNNYNGENWVIVGNDDGNDVENDNYGNDNYDEGEYDDQEKW